MRMLWMMNGTLDAKWLGGLKRRGCSIENSGHSEVCGHQVWLVEQVESLSW